MIRSLQPDDIDKLRKVHAQFFSNEFEFPDFLNNFLCCFVVVDNSDHIISGGGVRLMAEAVIMTDKNYPIKERRSALYQILDASEFVTKKADFGFLHAVTDNDKWIKHLTEIGFHMRGNILALDLNR